VSRTGAHFCDEENCANAGYSRRDRGFQGALRRDEAPSKVRIRIGLAGTKERLRKVSRRGFR